MHDDKDKDKGPTADQQPAARPGATGAPGPRARTTVKATGAATRDLERTEEDDEEEDLGPETTPTLALGDVITDPMMAMGATANTNSVIVAAKSGDLPSIAPLNEAEAKKLDEAAKEGRSSVSIEVATIAPPPEESAAPTRMEVAGPAPLPRPEDPGLTAGTAYAFVNEGDEGETEPR